MSLPLPFLPLQHAVPAIFQDLPIEADPLVLPLLPGHTHAVTTESISSAPVPGFDEGFDQGYAQGLAQGLAAAKTRNRRLVARTCEIQSARLILKQAAHNTEQQSVLEQQLAQLDALAAQFALAFEARLQHLETEALELAFVAVGRILGEQLIDPPRLINLLSQGFKQVRSSARITVIRLHPSDMALLNNSTAGQALQARFAEVDWQTDHRITPGGGLIHTPQGQLDTQLTTQLRCLADLWSQAISERQVVHPVTPHKND